MKMPWAQQVTSRRWWLLHYLKQSSKEGKRAGGDPLALWHFTGGVVDYWCKLWKPKINFHITTCRCKELVQMQEKRNSLYKRYSNYKLDAYPLCRKKNPYFPKRPFGSLDSCRHGVSAFIVLLSPTHSERHNTSCQTHLLFFYYKICHLLFHCLQNMDPLVSSRGHYQHILHSGVGKEMSLPSYVHSGIPVIKTWFNIHCGVSIRKDVK